MVRLLRPEPPSDLANQQLHTDAGFGNSPLWRSLRVRRLLHRKQGPAGRFGVAASPTTGKAAIIYTSDQYVNSAAEPANPFGSRACTPAGTNTINCEHTNI